MRASRFRAQLPGECSASECSLLCDDMHRMGYRDIAIDPSVRVAHNRELFEVLHEEKHDPKYYIYNSAAHASYRKQKGLFPRSDQVQCCPLLPGNDSLNWSDPGCFPYNYMQPPGSSSQIAAAS